MAGGTGAGEDAKLSGSPEESSSEQCGQVAVACDDHVCQRCQLAILNCPSATKGPSGCGRSV